jgi:hypothetical protein
MNALQFHKHKVLLLAIIILLAAFASSALKADAWGWSFGRSDRVISLAQALNFGTGAEDTHVSIDLGGGQYITTCENSVESFASYYVNQNLYVDGLDETNPVTRALRDSVKNPASRDGGSAVEGGTGISTGISGSISADETGLQCAPSATCVDGTTLRAVTSKCAVVETACGAGLSCSDGACITIPPISFTAFEGVVARSDGSTALFSATGHLEARPMLVRPGDSTYLFWNVAHARACTVSGGGQTWNAFSSGEEGQRTFNLTARTNFTLHCEALPGVVPSTIDQSVIVNVVPVFQEL